jgi:hypothetical protein
VADGLGTKTRVYGTAEGDTAGVTAYGLVADKRTVSEVEIRIRELGSRYGAAEAAASDRAATADCLVLGELGVAAGGSRSQFIVEGAPKGEVTAVGADGLVVGKATVGNRKRGADIVRNSTTRSGFTPAGTRARICPRDRRKIIARTGPAATKKC